METGQSRSGTVLNVVREASALRAARANKSPNEELEPQSVAPHTTESLGGTADAVDVMADFDVIPVPSTRGLFISLTNRTGRPPTHSPHNNMFKPVTPFLSIRMRISPLFISRTPRIISRQYAVQTAIPHSTETSPIPPRRSVQKRSTVYQLPVDDEESSRLSV